MTLSQVVHLAFPIYTYTYLGTVAIVFLITDFLRYKVIIVFEGIAYIATWVLLIWGKGLISVIVRNITIYNILLLVDER
jgi:thiamine transporter 2/3